MIGAIEVVHPVHREFVPVAMNLKTDWTFGQNGDRQGPKEKNTLELWQRCEWRNQK